jgi:ATP-dependent Clp protease ATP-binding subunit ClpC
MADRPPLPPERLDHAIDWLQRNLDALAAAERRSGAPRPASDVAPVSPGTAEPTAATPTAATPTAIAELARRGTGSPAPSDTRAAPGPAPEASAAATPSSAAATPSSATSPPSPAPSPPSPPAAPQTDTPLLDRIGRDLTRLAAEGELATVIGRAAELDQLAETLVRRSKRNPVLLGAAGAGKTAIVEGFAQRIAAGDVPAMLRGIRLVEVPLASLVAGTEYRGQLEERLAQLVKEASRPGIVLFFDEIHLLAGAGRSEGGMGADETLKPALARGEIAVVGATTPEEYRDSIERDAALARRFTTIAVSELDLDATRPILRSVRDALARARGVTASDAALEVLLDFADRRIAGRRFPDKAIDLLEGAVAAALVAGRTRVRRADAVRATEVWLARASTTPTLERFGRDLVRLAADGRLGPIVGRDREIDAIVEILMRRTRRDPLLLGPAGSGKSAIVEGLALRIAGGDVPQPLRDVHVFETALLPLGAAVSDDQRVLGDLLLEAAHPSVVVFFDEIHQLAEPAVRDLAQALKPALARGDIACVGATTGEEYQASLEPDPALVRRFTVVPVAPMDASSVMAVLRAVRDSLATARGVTMDDAALDDVVALSDDFLPDRSFPDKGVDVIEQAVAHALARGEPVVTGATVREALSAIAGVPVDPGPRLGALSAALRDAGALPPEPAERLVARLGVAMRGLDARRARPDVVVLLLDRAAASADALEALLARHLFGRDTARIVLDLGSMADDSSLSTLLGSAPGLVGSDRPLPLADLRRDPRQVVGFHGVDGAAPAVRAAVERGLAEGHLTDAMGRRLPLEAAVIVLTASDLTAAMASSVLGPGLLESVDVITETADDASARVGTWVRDRLLAPLAERFARRGIELRFDPGFVAWLEARVPAAVADAEAFIDREVAPAIVEMLPPSAAVVRVAITPDGGIAVEPA